MTLINSVGSANPSFFQKTHFNVNIDLVSLVEKVGYAFSRVINSVHIFIFNHFDLGSKERFKALDAAEEITPAQLHSINVMKDVHDFPTTGNKIIIHCLSTS